MPETIARQPLLHAIEDRLARDGTAEANLHAVLDQVLEAFGCPVGTLHDFDPASGTLRLRAHRGIPATILDRVQAIPVGKGMAGLAAERRQPVQVCNLQTDCSGVAKVGAKDTRMEGSIAVPMLAAGELRGVLGVAKPVVYEFSEAEIGLLQEVAGAIGRSFGEGRAREAARGGRA